MIGYRSWLCYSHIHKQTDNTAVKKINFKQFWLPACEFPKANFSGKIFKTIPVAKAKKKLKRKQKSVKQTKCRKTENWKLKVNHFLIILFWSLSKLLLKHPVYVYDSHNTIMFWKLVNTPPPHFHMCKCVHRDTSTNPEWKITTCSFLGNHYQYLWWYY